MGEVRLLELKAHYRDLTRADSWCTRHATPIEEVSQTDTYFIVGEGRLKLRVVDERDVGTLIYYQREDRPDPKRSRVSLLSIADPNPLLGILTQALGILVEVRKRRRVFRWGEVQIHLDQVDSLGTFVEFERMADSPREEEQARAEFAELRAALHISDKELQTGSYSDLLLNTETTAD